MRITGNGNAETVRDSIRRSRERMDNLQRQNASLKKVNAPSEDPIGASRVLQIRTDKMNNDQYQSNITMSETALSNAELALGELAELISRAKEIALGQASGASATDDTRLGVAEEITQLFQQAVATANRRIGDRYLFGGYKTQTPPIDENGRYRGDSGSMMLEISKDVFVTTNVPGHEAFNSNPQASLDRRTLDERQGVERRPAGEHETEENLGENVNVFDELQNLRIALLTGDTDGIRNTLERFDTIHGKLTAQRAKIGSRIQGLQTASTALERHNIVNAGLGSAIEDADMAQVVSDLAKEETVFRSTLQSSQRLLQPTLLEFLR